MSGLGDFVETYILAKLIKTCNVRDEKTNSRPIELEDLKETNNNDEL